MRGSLCRIVGEDEWRQAKTEGSYAPGELASDGFIHLCDPSQVLHVANLLYRGRDDLLILDIDPDRLEGVVVYEPGTHGESEHFPHLYRRLNLDAVRGAVSFPPSADGTFALPPALSNVARSAGGQLSESESSSEDSSSC